MTAKLICTGRNAKGPCQRTAAKGSTTCAKHADGYVAKGFV